MSKRTGKLELLAPAGTVECLHAAVSAGADAVYLGLGEFNARRNAGNFTLDSLREACRYAHLRGVAVYVTLNVEVLPSELESAVVLAQGAYAAGADAFIVQDIGLAAELGRRLPEAPLHASTQMNIHNAAGIALAAQLGLGRVTLARELRVAEIAELAGLAADYGMEIECFGHGALCICYSGQCLMSSMIGGRSANRGLCAQACRLPYELHREGQEGPLPSPGEHLLSPKDLSTADMIGQLIDAGVASLKVEGRMKSPDYVHAVVSVYRELIDSQSPASQAQHDRLSEAFSRGFTTAYLEGRRGNEIMSYGRPNNRGVFVGRVTRAGDGLAHVAAETQLHVGDVLEFWTNRGHFAETLEDARPDSNGMVRVAVTKRVGKGDRVFRVRNAAAAFRDDPCEPRIPVRGRVELRLGKAARVEFEAGDGAEYVRAEALGDTVEPARTKAVSPFDVASHVNRLGNTPFALGAQDLRVDVDDGVGIGFSQLHRLRAEALEQLEGLILARYGQAGRSHEDAAGLSPAAGDAACASRGSGRENASSGRSGQKPGGEQRVASGALEAMAWVTSPGCARAVRRAGVDGIYVPLLNFRRGQAQVAGVLPDDAEQAGYPKQCIMALPAIDHDPVYAADGSPMTREAAMAFDMWDYVREGKTVFADSVAGAIRALELGAQVEVGPHVLATNQASLRLLADWGVSRAWLSPELSLGQIADLAAASPLPLGLFASGAQELMITEHCLLMSQGPCAQQCETCERRREAHRLVDRKGFEFPVVTDLLGRSHLYNGIELDAVPQLPDFASMGISAVMVDATLMDKRAAANAALRCVRARDAALRDGRAMDKRPNTTTGHLFRGVS